jgi:hypothetical protein
MTTIIIFWSALMALTFFILQAGFNMLAALTDALYSSLIRIVSIILLFIIGFLIIGTISSIIDQIIRNGLFSALSMMFVLAVEIGILWFLVGWLWQIVQSLLEKLIDFVFTFLTALMTALAAGCESKYNYFLKKIMMQTEKG